MWIGKDSNGWIEIVSDSKATVENHGYTAHEYEGSKDVEPVTPAENETAWHWNGGDPELRDTGSNIKPDSQEAFEQIHQYFIDKEGSVDAGLDQVETLLEGGRGKVIDRAISQENYDVAINRIDVHQDMTNTEISDIKAILRGEA